MFRSGRAKSGIVCNIRRLKIQLPRREPFHDNYRSDDKLLGMETVALVIFIRSVVLQSGNPELCRSSRATNR
eukprot:scaffold18507_cov188-Amphora_coffeaeformis.AAC.5